MKDDLVLNAIAGRRVNGRGKVRANCPFCLDASGKEDRRQCLSLDLATGSWKCFRCETWGKLSEVPHDISTLAKKAALTKPKEPVSLPAGFVPLWTEDAFKSIALEQARAYLYGTKPGQRGVPLEVARAANIGACLRGEFAGRVIVPIHRGGALAGYVGRVWRKKHPLPYRYSTDFERAITIFNEAALYVQTNEPVIVVEGVFDTFPFWPDAVAVLGKTSIQQFELLAAARRPVCIAFDGDAWREGEALAMGLRRWGKHAASIRLPPTKDPDELPEWLRQEARACLM